MPQNNQTPGNRNSDMGDNSVSEALGHKAGTLDKYGVSRKWRCCIHLFT